MKIYTVLYSAYDGECSYDRPIKAFTKKEDATECADLCEEECKRIKSEVDAHYEEHKEVLEILHKKIREMLLERKRKGKKMNLRELPESRKSVEINNESRAIIQTHKYDPHFRILDDDYSYVVEELELD